MGREGSDSISVLLVGGDWSRAFETALGGRDGFIVESVESTTAATAQVSEPPPTVDCLLTGHDPPVIDAIAGIEAAAAADVPAIVVGTEPYENLSFDPFTAGADEYHRLRGGDGDAALAARRIDRLVETTRTVRERERLFETVFESPDIAMAIIDEQGTLVDVNQRALAFAGEFEEDNVLVTPFWETPWSLRSSASISEVKTVVERGLDGETIEFEFSARDRHHNLIEVACSIHPIERGDEVVGAVVLGDDITEKWSTNRRIRVLSRVLRHNLRNDLVAIDGHAEFVESKGEDPVLEHATAIHRVTDDLIEKCELARRIQQALTVDRKPIPTVDIDAVLGAELDSLRERHPDVEIERSVPESLSVRAEHGIDIAVRALLDNAIEHNEAATPRLRVSAETVDAPADATDPYHLGEAVEISIADNGPGMPDHELAVLAEGAETELEHSSGLGLWASNWIVADSGGRLDFAVSESGGTVATITLPAAPETDD